MAVSLDGPFELPGKSSAGGGQNGRRRRGFVQVRVVVLCVPAGQVVGVAGDGREGFALGPPDQDGLVAILYALLADQPAQGAVGLLGGLIPDGERLLRLIEAAAEGEAVVVVAGDQLGAVACVADLVGIEQGDGDPFALDVANVLFF